MLLWGPYTRCRGARYQVILGVTMRCLLTDSSVVPANSPNKAGTSAAAAVEGRELAKANTDKLTMRFRLEQAPELVLDGILTYGSAYWLIRWGAGHPAPSSGLPPGLRLR